MGLLNFYDWDVALCAQFGRIFLKLCTNYNLLLVPTKQAFFSIFTMKIRWNMESCWLALKKICLYYYWCVCMCEHLWVYTPVCRLRLMPEEGIGPSGAGVRVSCEPLYVVLEKWVQIIWEEKQVSIPAQPHPQTLIDQVPLSTTLYYFWKHLQVLSYQSYPEIISFIP